MVSTHTSDDKMSKFADHGSRVGTPGSDFSGFREQIVHFAEGQAEADLEVELNQRGA